MPGMTFKVDDQGTASVADDVARLQGSAIATGHDPDKVAHIDLSFTGGMSSLSDPYVYKQEGGLSYANLVDPMFWSEVLGTITVDGTVHDVDRMVWNDHGKHTFQFGVGANSKNKNELGGSAWVQTCQDGAADGMSCMNSHHWDLNLAMTKVPEPGTLGLLSLGLFGLLASRRKRA
ncbi:MAG: PEP-CTERM sorting domain-containing protein [Pseudomonadales bacterium]|nr:PEP-CTERM sorting domain-containing protein [Pseudomonadales bacterium]